MCLTRSSDDPALGDLVLAFEALGVDAEQDLDAVADPLGDLSWGHSPVKPGGQDRRGGGRRADVLVGSGTPHLAERTGGPGPMRGGDGGQRPTLRTLEQRVGGLAANRSNVSAKKAW